MTNSHRTRESDFFDAVETILQDIGEDAAITQIRRKIPAYIKLSSADRTQSPTRPGEQLWEQQVRNIICHRDCEGSPIKAGRFIYHKRRLSLGVSLQLDLFDNDNEGKS